MQENPPLMELAEETPASVTFRFRGKRWALGTLLLGLALLGVVLKQAGHAPPLGLAVLGGFGVLLLYSSLYSYHSVQWLTVDAQNRTIRFHKKNFYGLLAWEKPAFAFQGIQVLRAGKASNWSIVLVADDGYRLQLGESFVGAWTRAKALELAHKVSSRSGLPVEILGESNHP